MKKIIYTLLICCSLLLASCASSTPAPVKNSLQTANLNGKVKQVTEFCHPDGGAMLGAGRTQNQQIEIIRVLEYSPEGFITKIRTTSPEESYNEIPKYDENNKALSVEFVVDTLVVQRTEYSYNRKGLRESEKIYNKENKLVRENTFEYDKNGHISRVTTLNTQQNTSEKMDIVCDQDGNKISSISYYSDGKPNIENKVTYNQYGDIATSSSSDKMMGGDLIQTTYSYTNYDSNKNWLARAIAFEGKIVETIEREIEYYQ